MNEVIRGLSNEEYHHGEQYADYISSTQLKHYLKSPKAYRHALLNPEEEKSEALEFGSLFHSAIEAMIREIPDEWESSLAVFEPPVNEKTGQPYGSATKAYSEAYAKFLEDSKGKTVVTQSAKDRVCRMTRSMFFECRETSEQIKKLAKWAKEIETSYFYETEDGIKLKIRPDLLTNGKLIDWKSCSCDLDEDSIIKQIINYRYDVSLSMYQWVLHEITKVWYQPYLVFVNKAEPYETVMVDMSLWCFSYDKEFDIVSTGVGAIEFKRLLELHTECNKNNEWPGVECNITPIDGAKVLKPDVPYWFGKRYFEE